MLLLIIVYLRDYRRFTFYFYFIFLHAYVRCNVVSSWFPTAILRVAVEVHGRVATQ